MAVEELTELVNRLRAERDKFKEQLGCVRKIRSENLNLDTPGEEKQGDRSIFVCEKCGKKFISPDAKKGHKAHCDGSITEHEQDREEQSEERANNELAILAEKPSDNLKELEKILSPKEFRHSSPLFVNSLK